MKKRLFLILISLCLLTSILAPVASAETTATEETIPVEDRSDVVYENPTAPEGPTEETRAPGYCGEDLTWDLSGGTLTISGSGPMDDYPSGSAPWYDSRDSITSLVLSGAVTRIGDEAFSDYDRLATIDFGSSLVEIGRAAFLSCDSLTVISLPATFRTFEEDAFRDCARLSKVDCAGSMPHFRANCLWNGSNLTIYCPVNNPWPEQYVLELEENFHGRLQVLASDNSDPYKQEEPETTESTTEATTEPTTAPTETTQPEVTTEPPTEEATQLPVTTEPTTQPSAETESPTGATASAAEEGKDLGGSLWIPLLIICGILTAGILGALLFKRSKGGKYAR